MLFELSLPVVSQQFWTRDGVIAVIGGFSHGLGVSGPVLASGTDGLRCWCTVDRPGCLRYRRVRRPRTNPIVHAGIFAR